MLRLTALFATLLLVISPSGAQRKDIEILSKTDALQLFAMSRQQWEQKVSAAVAAGADNGHGSGPFGADWDVDSDAAWPRHDSSRLLSR